MLHVSGDMCTVRRGSFWSWFDVNRFTFHEDMHEKLFVHFRSRWPWPLTIWPQICSISYSVLMVVSPSNVKYLRLSDFKYIIDTGQDWQTDLVQRA